MRISGWSSDACSSDLTRKCSRRRAARRNTRSALLFLSPWLIGFAVFTAWPLVYSAYLSFTDYDVINDPSLVGWATYVELFEDPTIGLALGHTFFYPLVQGIGLAQYRERVCDDVYIPMVAVSLKTHAT